MKGIRIQPSGDGKSLLIDVICDCGNNALKNEATGERSFKHVLPTTHSELPETVLACDCGRRHRMDTHSGHGHVTSL